MNRINKLLAGLTKKKEKAQINEIRNERPGVTADTTEIQRVKNTTMNNYIPTNWTT